MPPALAMRAMRAQWSVTDYPSLVQTLEISTAGDLSAAKQGRSISSLRQMMVQRSMTAMFPSSWRAPAAGVRLSSRLICSAFNSMLSAAMFS